jgi:alpha-D-xyloside xylohydrolase
MVTVAAGIQHVVYGSSDKFTPYAFCDAKPLTEEIAALPNGMLPFNVNDIRITVNDRGTIVEIPLSDSEQL